MTVVRWVQRSHPALLIDVARPCRPTPGDRWLVDETDLKAAGWWICPSGAMYQLDPVIDVLVCGQRDLVATRRLGTHASMHRSRPAEVTTDLAPACSRVLDEWMPTTRQVLKLYPDTLHCGDLCRPLTDATLPS